MGEFLTKLGNGIGVILLIGAGFIFLIMFLRNSRRETLAGDYRERVNAYKKNSASSNKAIIFIALACVLAALFASGAIRIVIIIIGILLIVCSCLPNLMKGNSKEFQHDMRVYTKEENQKRAYTSEGRGKVKGASVGAAGGAAAGAATGAAIGAAFGGVGAAPGAAIGAVAGGVTGIVGGKKAGGQMGKSMEEMYQRRADNINDIDEDFHGIINKDEYNKGIDTALDTAKDVPINAATSVMGHTGPELTGADLMGVAGDNMRKAYKRQGLTDEQIQDKISGDLKYLDKPKQQPSFLQDNTVETQPSFMTPNRSFTDTKQASNL